MYMTNVTVQVGNAGADPELKFLPDGKAVSEFRIAVSVYKGWGDARTEHTIWWTVKTFGKLAEHVAESILKGTRVVVVGKIDVETWGDADNPKSKNVIIADEVAPSLTWATAVVTRAERSDSGTPQPTTTAGDTPPNPAGKDNEPF